MWLITRTRATASETGLGADLCHKLRNSTQFIRSYWTPSFALMSVVFNKSEINSFGQRKKGGGEGGITVDRFVSVLDFSLLSSRS